MGDHANDFKEGVFNRIGEGFELNEADVLADGIVVPQIFVDEGLVDDRELSGGIDFGFGEGAAVNELDTEHREISFAAQLESCVPFLGMGLAGDFDVAGEATVGRKSAGFRDFEDPGQSFETGQKRAIETGDLFCGLVVLGKRDASDKDVIGLKTEMHFAESDKAAHEQAGGDEER